MFTKLLRKVHDLFKNKSEKIERSILDQLNFISPQNKEINNFIYKINNLIKDHFELDSEIYREPNVCVKMTITEVANIIIKLSADRILEHTICLKYTGLILDNINKLKTEDKTLTKLLEKMYANPNKEIELYAKGVVPDLMKTITNGNYLRSRMEIYESFKNELKKGKITYLFLAIHDPNWLFTNENIIAICGKKNDGVKIRIVNIEDSKSICEKIKRKNIDIANKKIFWTRHKRFIALFGQRR